MKANEIEIQLLFEQPLEISKDEKSPDKAIVTILGG